MDPAEAWLREHDPDYARHKAGWRHIRNGEYVCPDADAKVGDPSFLESIVFKSEGEWVSRLGSRERHCLLPECGQVFIPRSRVHAYCCENHRQRAVMRQRRAQEKGRDVSPPGRDR